jgi:hypothetical protein
MHTAQKTRFFGSTISLLLRLLCLTFEVDLSKRSMDVCARDVKSFIFPDSFQWEYLSSFYLVFYFDGKGEVNKTVVIVFCRSTTWNTIVRPSSPECSSQKPARAARIP